MTPRYPGATWRPTGSAGKMPAYPNACSLHEAVTRADSLYGWVQSAKACQAFVGQHGIAEQYMEWDDWANGVKDGNSHVITIETFDGLLIQNNPYREIGMGGVYGDSANTGRWDDGQCERLADIAAFLHLEIGIDLRQKLTSQPDDAGFGPHRLGVEPWRGGVGESWTAHDGKPCPGDLRIQQIPGIIARAQQIAAVIKDGTASYLPPGPVDLATALLRLRTGGPVSPTSPKPTTPASPTVPEDDMPLTDTDVDRIAKAVEKRIFSRMIRGASFESHVRAQTTRSARIVNALLAAGGNRQVLQQIRKLVTR